jgi:hypothetical protein
VLVIAIATLWVVAGSHCRLEILPGFQFLSCCQHAEPEKTPAHHEKECGDDGCAAVELGFYKLSKPQPPPLKPLLTLATWQVPVPAECQRGNSDSLVSASRRPPELPRIWQFFQRTALPPRAPSLVS